MTRLLTRRGFFGVILVVVSALLLSGCTPLILPESWAGITPDGVIGADGRYEARYLYIAYRDTVFRVDTQTFPESRPTERFVDWAAHGNRLFTRPVLGEDNLIYVGSYGHQLYAYSPAASPREVNIPSFAPTPGAVPLIADPLYYNGAVYQGQGDKGINVLDAKTGALRTAFTDTQNGIWAAPLIDSATNTLYFASMDQSLYALTADTMTLRWKLPLDGAVGGTPLLADGVLYVGTFNSEMIAVDVSKDQPEILRRFKTKGWVWSTPVLSEGILYFGDMSGAVYALNSADFSPKWQAQVEGAARGRVAVVDDKVIAAGEQRYLKAFNRESGALMWTSSPPTDDRILGDLVVIGQDVIVTTLSENQLVVAFNLATGGRAWFVRKPNSDDFARLTLTPSAR
ncbi:MAG: PQQ-like beta-propeller repeat protein [Anaerolinea sp.]|nr:PQQ-like beta-propeller repeat protein [Anaerolinea sp.]CAG0996619.1 putative protein YxaL [Anaerolineae bacterium]